MATDPVEVNRAETTMREPTEMTDVTPRTNRIAHSSPADRNDMSRKTPYSQSQTMSSSLKERLKKCGRYHPATPTSSRPKTPLSSCQNTARPATPLSNPLSTHPGSSPALSKHASTPTSSGRYTPSFTQDKPTPVSLGDSVDRQRGSGGSRHSPISGRRKLPQPRNILAGKSNAGSTHNDSHSDCQDHTNVSSTKSVDGSSDKQNRLNLKGEIDSLLAHTETESLPMIVTTDNPDKLHEIHLKSGCKSSAKKDTPATPETSSHSSMIVSKSEVLLMPKMTSLDDFEDNVSSVSISYDQLIAEKKQLDAKLKERQEVLRKLNMVKTYRKKNDLSQLQELIDKWRSACQEAILDLHRIIPDPRPPMTQFLNRLGIDTVLLHYNKEDECFDDM